MPEFVSGAVVQAQAAMNAARVVLVNGNEAGNRLFSGQVQSPSARRPGAKGLLGSKARFTRCMRAKSVPCGPQSGMEAFTGVDACRTEYVAPFFLRSEIAAFAARASL